MNSTDRDNPYETPGIDPVYRAGWTPDDRMQYMRSVEFIWENPNWILNLLLLGACLLVANLIPVLPVLVLVGYQCVVMEALIHRPNDRYPDFDVNAIMDYLVRGIWPFLIALVCGMVLGLVMLLLMAIPFLVLVLLASEMGEEGAIVGIIGISLGVLAVVILSLAANIVMVPFLLRAALTQDFGASLDWNFAKDFVRRMWKETLLTGLFLVAVALAAEVIGLLLFCVGILLTLPAVYLAQAHLGAQLYRVYLARGGEKIPLKAPAMAAPI